MKNSNEKSLLWGIWDSASCKIFCKTQNSRMSAISTVWQATLFFPRGENNRCTHIIQISHSLKRFPLISGTLYSVLNDTDQSEYHNPYKGNVFGVFSIVENFIPFYLNLKYNAHSTLLLHAEMKCSLFGAAIVASLHLINYIMYTVTLPLPHYILSITLCTLWHSQQILLLLLPYFIRS